MKKILQLTPMDAASLLRKALDLPGAKIQFNVGKTTDYYDNVTGHELTNVTVETEEINAFN